MSAWREKLFRVTPMRIALAVALVTVVVHGVNTHIAGRLDGMPVVGRLESIFYDLKFRERRAIGLAPRPGGNVVIGAIDEKAIGTVGRWPWSRADMARVIDRLTEMNARVIAFDMIYSDAVTDGADGAARRLATRFQEVSLDAEAAAKAFEQLEGARTAAAGALESARSLGSKAPAARDLEMRLAPLSSNVSAAIDTLARIRTMQKGYGDQLALEGAGKSPDEQLAEAIHRSDRVVLGTFAMRPAEVEQLKAGEREKGWELAANMGLGLPTLFVERNGPIANEAEDPAGVAPLIEFDGVKAVLEPLVIAPDTPDGETPPRTSLALFNARPDPDAVIRREMLAASIRGGEGPLVLPSLPLGALLKYHSAAPWETRLWSHGPGQLGEIAILPNSFPAFEGVPQQSDLRAFPVDSEGEAFINYYGKYREFPSISIGDVWAGTLPPDAVAGKVVFIGATATGTFDQRVTPFDDLAAGVITHATMADNMLTGQLLQRPLWSLLVEWAGLVLLALALGRFLEKSSVLAGVPITIIAMLVWHAIDLSLFCAGHVSVSFLPIGEMAAIYVFQTIYRYNTEEKEKRQIRRAFQFYLTKSVMDDMLKNPSKLKLGGDKRVLSVLFSDIRGFTTISERLTPEQLAKLINEYLTPMTNLVFETGGTLDKYIGDALMAIWGAPVEQPDHALRCCRTAVAMMRELGKLQEAWRMDGRDYPPIDIGIGINSGPMVVGNMGADQRFDYTVLGDNVNLASRLEGTNKDYQSHIIISESTLLLCEGRIAARQLGAVRVKGKREPVRIYELMDDKPATGDLAEIIAKFDAGVQAFREQRWADARAKFLEIQADHPDDGPTRAYLGFVDEYEKDPPGEGWDGVYTMTHK